MLLAGDAPGWNLDFGVAGPLRRIISGGAFGVCRGEGQPGDAKVVADVVSDGLDEGASCLRWGLDGIAGERKSRSRSRSRSRRRGGLLLALVGGLVRRPLLGLLGLLSGGAVSFLVGLVGELPFRLLAVDAVLHAPEDFGRDAAAGDPHGAR